MAKRVFLWYRSQRDVHLFCEFRTTFAPTKHVEREREKESERERERERERESVGWGGRERER